MSTAKVVHETSIYNSGDASSKGPQRPSLTAMSILAGDIVGLSVTLGVFLGNTIIGRYDAQSSWLPPWSLLPLFLVMYWFFDSYPGISVSSVDEIRRIVLANTTVFLFVSVMLALHGLVIRSILLYMAACIGASVVTLAMRAAVRKLGSHFDWWGYPVVLFGCGPVALLVLHKLKTHPHLGMRPVAVVNDQDVHMEMEGIPVYGYEHLDAFASSGVRHAIVAVPDLSQSEWAEALELGSDAFPHLILIPDKDSIWKVGSYTRDLMGIPGIQVRNNLLDNRSRVVKRMIDLAGSTLLLLLLLPILALISLAIVVESGFPVFYFDKRLGYGGWIFHMWKFRTMVQHSAEVLDRYLATNPELQKEWAQYQKLRNDPRITRVGRVLRKTSLDELPQLWNVIRGEMSLVGPRPRLLEVNVPKYQVVNTLYGKTIPGLTGLWQVSGRNRTTYEERIAYDAYYIRNWSVWMDIYLLAKTVGVVITGDGAY
jgi:Undecaprenyl-phosphate galactose phosphotransferase WbaP